jgi:hypothetical protein
MFQWQLPRIRPQIHPPRLQSRTITHRPTDRLLHHPLLLCITIDIFKIKFIFGEVCRGVVGREECLVRVACLY